MRRKSVWLAVVALVASGFVMSAASAHQCPDEPAPATTSTTAKAKKKDPPPPPPPADEECQETAVYEDWRPNYIPLFDLPDREEQGAGTDGEQQRYDAQRWRDECNNDGEYRQQCQWVYGGTSATPYPTDIDNPRPNELHAGYAANHCFLAEAAHDCDSHEDTEFGTHDPHGGAIYVDVCLATNPDSKYCDDGVEDTQAGVTIVDHLECPMGCSDEYHVVRPADPAYTTEQMDDSVAAISGIAGDPQTWLCGYPEHSACP